MPTYTYQCRSCGNRFDARQSFSDDPLTECAVCGAQGSVFRVIQPAGIVFKGSGWYVTDNRGNNPANSKSKPSSNGKSENGNGSNGEQDSASNGSSNGDGNTNTNTEASSSTEKSSSEAKATTSGD
jgi:putative FmdB family regulatory protein